MCLSFQKRYCVYVDDDNDGNGDDSRLYIYLYIPPQNGVIHAKGSTKQRPDRRKFFFFFSFSRFKCLTLARIICGYHFSCCCFGWFGCVSCQSAAFNRHTLMTKCNWRPITIISLHIRMYKLSTWRVVAKKSTYTSDIKSISRNYGRWCSEMREEKNELNLHHLNNCTVLSRNAGCSADNFQIYNFAFILSVVVDSIVI